MDPCFSSYHRTGAWAFSAGTAICGTGIANRRASAFPWVRCGADYVLGFVEMADGNLEASYNHFIASIRLAWEVQSILQVLRHVTGLAMWYARMEEYETAAEIAAFVLQHPARGPEMTRFAQQILLEAEDVLGDTALTEINERAGKLALADIVERILTTADILNDTSPAAKNQ